MRNLRSRFPLSSILLPGLAAAAVATAQLPSPILPDEATQVSEHVHLISGFPNVVIVTGDQATLVVDTGLGPSQGATVARVAQRLARGPKLYLTTTHFHPEHAAGEAGFPPETVLIRPQRQQQEMERDGQGLIERFGGFNPQYGELLKGVTSMRTPDVVFDDDLRLELGGARVRLMWLGVGHTEGDELIFVEPDSVLISGDIVQNKVVPSVSAAGGSFTSWIEVLNRLEELQPRIVVPTHSRVGDGSLIAAERAFIQDMRGRALDLKRQGVSADDAGRRLTEEFQRDYPEWAANTDWSNVTSVPGFVRRVYQEDQ